MSTRGIIRVKRNGKQVDIYRHWDCYPTGLGAELVAYLSEIQNWCGNKVVKYITENLDGEITFYNHVDIEYMYIIDCDKNTLKCYQVNNWDKPMKKRLVNLKKELQSCRF